MAGGSSAEVKIGEALDAANAALDTSAVDAQLPQVDVQRTSPETGAVGSEEIQTEVVREAGIYFQHACAIARWGTDLRAGLAKLGEQIDAKMKEATPSESVSEIATQLKEAVQEIRRASSDTQGYILTPATTEEMEAAARTKRDDVLGRIESCNQLCLKVEETLMKSDIDPTTGGEVLEQINALGSYVKALHKTADRDAATFAPEGFSPEDGQALTSRLNAIYRLDREFSQRAAALSKHAEGLEQGAPKAALESVLPMLSRGALYSKIASIDRLASSHIDYRDVVVEAEEGKAAEPYQAMNHRDAVAFAGRIDEVAAKIRETAKLFKDSPTIYDELLKYNQKLVDPLAPLITEAREVQAASVAAAKAEAKAAETRAAEARSLQSGNRGQARAAEGEALAASARRNESRPAGTPAAHEASLLPAAIRAELLKAMTVEGHPDVKLYLARFAAPPKDGQAEIRLQDGRTFTVARSDYRRPDIKGNGIELAETRGEARRPEPYEPIYVAIKGGETKQAVAWSYAFTIDAMWRHTHRSN